MNSQNAIPKLSLAPNWWPLSRDEQRQFIVSALESPAERIYIGQSVCSLRDRLAPRELFELAELLNEGGKQVVLTTLSLLATERDIALLKQLCKQDKLAIEANEMGAVGAANEANLPFVAGAGLNVYNLASLQWLKSLGMTTYQPPLEMNRANVVKLMNQAEEQGVRGDFELELIAYGYPPIAVSARCATARVAGRNRNRCEKICQENGSQVANSLEGDAMLRLNGIQIHGDEPIDLLGDLVALRKLNPEWLRIDPGPEGDLNWLGELQQALDTNAGSFRAPIEGLSALWNREGATLALSND